METTNHVFFRLSSLLLLLLGCTTLVGQTTDPTAIDITGTWEIQGTIMGDDGSGWILPHKQSAADCGNDHSVFLADQTGHEVTYQSSCEPNQAPFTWEKDGDRLHLTRGERQITWHILSVEEDLLKVGVQLGPDSERRMYVAYKRATP